MAGSTEMLAAFRELTTAKQLERSDLLDLLRDGIQAALVRKFGPNVQVRAERGRAAGDHQGRAPAPGGRGGRGSELADRRSRRPATRIPTSRSATCSRKRCRSSSSAGSRCRPPSSASSSACAKASAPGSATSSPPRWASCSRGEVQQIERGKLVIMLNKFREAEAIIPYREQNHREHFHQGDTIRAVLKRLEETPKGPRLILSPRRSALRQGAVQARGARDPAADRRDPRHRPRGGQPDQGGRHLPRRRHRSGGRLRRPQGLARAGGGERAGRRAHRHRALVARPGALRPAGAGAGAGGEGVQRSRGQDDPGRGGRGSALARHRAERAERAARLGAHRLEDRPLLEPRVAGAGRRGPAVRAAAARGGDGRAGAAQRAQGPVTRAHGDSRERRLPDAQRHPRPRARGHRQDSGHDRRDRPSSCSASWPSSPTRTAARSSGAADVDRLLGPARPGATGAGWSWSGWTRSGRSCRQGRSGAWWWRRTPARAPWTRWSGSRRPRGCRW